MPQNYTINLEMGNLMKDIHKILQLGYNNEIPTAGKVLLSEPFLDEDIFSRAVILLVNHSIEGSFGLILNKPLPQKISTIFEDAEYIDNKVFLGGPVEQDRLFFIYHGDYPISDSIEFMKGVYIGGSFEDLISLLNQQKVDREQFRFFVGYSGWEDGQLDDELKRNTWVVSKITKEEIFTATYDQLWEIGLKKIGKDYSKWSYLPKSPELN